MAKTCSLISPFCAPHSICLNISLWLVSFVRKCRSSSTPVVVRKVVVLPSKKQYFRFLKKVFVFQKTCFKVKVFKAFQNVTWKHTDLLNEVLFLKSQLLIRFSYWLQNETSTRKRSCEKPYLWKKHPSIFCLFDE